MDERNQQVTAKEERIGAEPLLYRKREYLDAIEADGTISSTQKTHNPDDYGPDD